MKREKAKVVSLGLLQLHVETTTTTLRRAQKAKLRADEAYEQALQAHERARVELNAGIATLKASATVPNPYAS
jgi:hypothetical protein